MSPAEKRLAVSGINCIRPRAPLFDTARGLNFDSTAMTARNSAGCTFDLRLASAMIAENREVSIAAAAPTGGVVFESRLTGSGLETIKCSSGLPALVAIFVNTIVPCALTEPRIWEI